jgi:hypothetical protein
MLPVATVDCAAAGSSANVVKLIHRIKANQYLELLILSSSLLWPEWNGPGDNKAQGVHPKRSKG